MIDDLWYKNAIIYCLDVKTFMDADGDGIGDFEGLSRRMDYLAGLGVTCLWLLPFNASPRRDNGYDITDFYGVDAQLGSLGDFVDFSREAKKHGIRILMDLVLNHTSNRHPWFLSARRSPNSPYRDWYHWSKKRPPDADLGMVFPGVQKATWTRDPIAREYYFHRFYAFQPDLNTSNPEVREEIRRIIGFWLQLGVNGFRLDAVPFVIQREGVRQKPVEMYEQLQELRAFLQWRTGDAILLGEANVLPAQDLEFFGDEGDRMHMMFNFQVNQALFYAQATGEMEPLVEALEATRVSQETSQWAHFLRNNDELDLGRLAPEHREQVFAEFGPQPRMQCYRRGLRRRLAPMLNGDRRRWELAYSLLFTLPGTPVLLYGDEIGMGEDLSLKERSSVRTPMQWSAEANGGFSRAKKTWLPVIDEGPYGYQKVNVAAQKRDPSSMLNWMERIIRARKECLEIGWGDFEVIQTDAPSVLALRYQWRGNACLFLHNFDPKARPVSFRATSGRPHRADHRERRLVNLLSEDHALADQQGRFTVEMEGYGYRWYRVGGLDYLLNRSR